MLEKRYPSEKHGQLHVEPFWKNCVQNTNKILFESLIHSFPHPVLTEYYKLFLAE